LTENPINEKEVGGSKTIYEGACSCRNCLTFLEAKSKNLSLPSPIIHELLKYQSKYCHRVLTGCNISGYPSSSGKKSSWGFDEHTYNYIFAGFSRWHEIETRTKV